MDHREARYAVDWVQVYEDSCPCGEEVFCYTLINLRIQ